MAWWDDGKGKGYGKGEKGYWERPPSGPSKGLPDYYGDGYHGYGPPPPPYPRSLGYGKGLTGPNGMGRPQSYGQEAGAKGGKDSQPRLRRPPSDPDLKDIPPPPLPVRMGKSGANGSHGPMLAEGRSREFNEVSEDMNTKRLKTTLQIA